MVNGSFYESDVAGRIFRREWPTQGKPKAGALFVHGLGDHSGRHERHLDLFARQGVLCQACDLPGHGRSDGPRGHVDSLAQLLDLIEENLGHLRARLGPQAPIGLLGHSMGAFLCLNFLARRRHNLRFCWISSPLIDPSANAGPFKQALARVLDRVYPRFTLRSGVRTHLCKRDPESIAATRRDRLVHRQVSVRMGTILLDASSDLMERAGDISADLRLLFTHGEHDRICPPAPAKAFFDLLPSPNKHYALFRGLLHEPFNDLGKEAFYECLEEWIAREVLLDGQLLGQKLAAA